MLWWKKCLVLVVVVLGVVQVGRAEPPPKTDANPATVDAAKRKVFPALVRILVVMTNYQNGREVKNRGGGSGAIISPDGYVVTNHHVAGHGRRFTCRLADHEELDATLVGTDPLTDIAVLKLDLKGRDPKKPLPFAQFGDSDALRIGDPVLAMGSPAAVSQSVTMGIVSNVELMLPKDFFGQQKFLLDGEDVLSVMKWIGHDAVIFGGNSGGPLVNLKGEIVGVNEVGIGSLGGAIPSNLARRVAEALIKEGGVKRSWLGLTFQPLLKSSKADHGVLISSVASGSPAERAGLRAGDVLLSYNGRRLPKILHEEQMPEVNRLLFDTPIGTKVALEYQRGSQVDTVNAITRERGVAHGREGAFPAWGITVRELSLLEASRLRREPGDGLLVTGVRPGWGAAEAKPALKAKDILTRVNGKPVRTLKDLQTLTDGLKEGAEVVAEVERKHENFQTVVRLGEHEVKSTTRLVHRAWLPVKTQPVNKELAKALNLAAKSGVRVTQILMKKGEEASFGLKVGDIIVGIDGNPLDASGPGGDEVFSNLLRRRKVGAKVKLDILRDGSSQVVEQKLMRSPTAEEEYPEYRDARFEFRARALTFEERVAEEAETDSQGVLVTQVESGGVASIANLGIGDVILAVDGNPVSTVDALKEQMERVGREKPRTVVLYVRREKNTLYIELEPVWNAAEGS